MKLNPRLRAATALLCAMTAFAQSPPPAPASSASPHPALWQIKGAGRSVYLFGTVHVMKPDVPWETDRVKDALKASDALYVEIADTDPASLQKLQPLILQSGLDPAHPLSTRLSKQDLDSLDAAARKLGLPGEAVLEPMKPWLVYATLELLPAMKAGYAATSGIDAVLIEQAKGLGKPVKGLETAEQQISLLSGLSDDQQVAMLHQELDNLPQSGGQLNQIVTAWTSGDVEKLGAMETTELRDTTPALYQKLVVERNLSFTAQIVTMLQLPASGNAFVAIGAAHLAGPDSVIKQLEKHGYTVERVQ